jgi:hypothetical protein
MIDWLVFNATFNNISVISWWSVLFVEETGGPWENHRPVTSQWQTLSHNRAPDKLRICIFYAMKTSKNACIIRSECTHYECGVKHHQMNKHSYFLLFNMLFYTFFRSCRVGPLVQCDYCPLLYHLDCLNPPMTSLPFWSFKQKMSFFAKSRYITQELQMSKVLKNSKLHSFIHLHLD